MLGLLFQNCFFDSSGNLELLMFWNDHSHHIHKTLGLIPIPCFSLNCDQSQIQQIQDFGTDPNTLFFITLGSINYSLYMTLGLILESHFLDQWDWSQCDIWTSVGRRLTVCAILFCAVLPEPNLIT